MSVLRRIVTLIVGLSAVCFAGVAAAADALTEPAARAAFIAADRAALLERIHPRWRDFQAQWRQEVCPFARVREYDPEQVSCGYVLVPENRRDPNSRLIRIAVARARSIAESEPPAGVTVYLSGGPGGPAAEGAILDPDNVARHRAFLELSDFVFVDQRGVGYSEAALCRGLFGDNETLSMDAFRALAERRRACLQEGRTRGIDVDAYTTWDNALDFRDIRRALGLETWNVFGVSYGTELGAMLLRVDGEAVRAAVLDSVYTFGGSSMLTPGMVSALAKLDEACKADPACFRRYGDLEPLARRATERFDAEPFTVEGLDPEIYPDGKIVVNGPLVASAIFQALYNHEFFPALPGLMEALAEGRTLHAKAAYVDVLTLAEGHDFGHGLNTVASCAGFGFTTPELLAQQPSRDPFWDAAFLDAARADDCAQVGRPPADPLLAATPLVTDRPVMLLAGGVDPITPPYMAETVKASLPSAVYVLAPWAGHGVARSHECLGVKIMPAFLADPIKAPDLSCVAEMKPPKFVIDYKQTKGPFALYRAFEDGEATGALAWLGASVATLAFAIVAFPMGLLARTIDRRPVIPAAWARRVAWLAALLGIVGLALIAVAALQTIQSHLLLAPLGLAGPAALGGWLILASGAAGIAAIALIVAAILRHAPPIGTILGVLITGIASLALAAFASVHGLA
jgi:pimeloyl-ACP methyl ester carboxylesterase